MEVIYPRGEINEASGRKALRRKQAFESLSRIRPWRLGRDGMDKIE